MTKSTTIKIVITERDAENIYVSVKNEKTLHGCGFPISVSFDDLGNNEEAKKLILEQVEWGLRGFRAYVSPAMAEDMAKDYATRDYHGD